jgi:hypothetical protein
MKRRQLMRWGCACFSLAASSTIAGEWKAPTRFGRPESSSEEGGLWAIMDDEERKLRRSPFRMREDALSTYLNGIVCKLGGEHCKDVRVYAVRAPYFNANMAPNGMMQVWSGLLLRVENEAQLAAVLGHELGHYLQRHSLAQLRDAKSRAAIGQVMGMFGAAGALGQLAMLAGQFSYSRDQEREADEIGIQLMREAGYDPKEASKVWANLLEELRAIPENDPSKNSVLFASHPPSEDRRKTLEALALGSQGDFGAKPFREKVSPHLPMMLEDELARGRWSESIVLLTRLIGHEPSSPHYLHFRGEAYRLRNTEGDSASALSDLTAAVQMPQVLPKTYRSLGYLHRARGNLVPMAQAWDKYIELMPNANDVALIQQYLKEIK